MNLLRPKRDILCSKSEPTFPPPFQINNPLSETPWLNEHALEKNFTYLLWVEFFQSMKWGCDWRFYSNNRWDRRLNKSIRPSLVTAGSHAHDTCLSRHVYWYLSCFHHHSHRAHFTVIFHLRLPLILKWKPKHSRGRGVLKRASAEKHNKKDTQEPRTRRRPPSGVIPSKWPVQQQQQKPTGEALCRELILHSEPPERKGNAGTGQRRDTL